MKKSVLASILCVILSVSACSFAEQAASKAVFENFTITIEKVSKTANKLDIRLSADFATEVDAAGYHFSQRNMGETDAELEAHYRDFLDNQWFRPTPDTRRKLTAVVASMKTLSGEDFPPEGSFSFSEFAGYKAKQQPDGKWRSEVKFEVDDFLTDEKGILIDFYLFDAEEDAPFPSAPQQTLYVEFP